MIKQGPMSFSDVLKNIKNYSNKEEFINNNQKNKENQNNNIIKNQKNNIPLNNENNQMNKRILQTPIPKISNKKMVKNN